MALNMQCKFFFWAALMFLWEIVFVRDNSSELVLDCHHFLQTPHQNKRMNQEKLPEVPPS